MLASKSNLEIVSRMFLAAVFLFNTPFTVLAQQESQITIATTAVTPTGSETPVVETTPLGDETPTPSITETPSATATVVPPSQVTPTVSSPEQALLTWTAVR
jgi:hypothetical protein